jgi:flagellar biosynthesis protein FlhA
MADTGAGMTTMGNARDIGERLLQAMRRGDVALAVAVLVILTALILPLPSWLLDFGLSISITFSVLVLMVAVFIEKPLQFSSFPMVLLIATLIRLSLNMASTRLILGHGNEGVEGAGQVIAAFSSFIMSGSFVIGIIVFIILVIVNFVVITKGSGRIAEVAARFTLDGLPGKQMAIDADLSAGMIDETQAKKRRSDLEAESQFFGAMDGASKFVRGDAIAGLMIVGINVVAGMIIGMAQGGMSFMQAADIYTRLTVGDGLVTQVPSLLISVAAGMLVTKAGVQDSVDKALFDQLAGYPRAIGTAGALMGLMAVVPGMPFLPFAMLAGGMGVAAVLLDRNQRRIALEEETNKTQELAMSAPPAEEPISTALKMDLVRLELGYGLLQLISNPRTLKLTDQIKALRRAIAGEMGFIMPSVRIQDNMQLPANTYIIYVKEVESGRGDLRPNMLLVMDPRGEDITIPGEPTKEPTFGLPAMWVEATAREEALFRGYTVVDPPTVVTTHITEIVKDNMAELLSHSETQKLMDELDKIHQKLVAELIPTSISVGGVQRVLQNLLLERVSIRDLPTILEGIAEACSHTRNVTLITEHVRARLARQISEANTGPQGFIPLLTLSAEWEQAFSESLVGAGEDKQLSMAPSRLQEFISKVRQSFERHAMQGESPVLLTGPSVRPYVRSIVERFRASTVVMSQAEIHAKAKIKTLGQI